MLDFNIPSQELIEELDQKISKDVENLNNIINHLDLIGIYVTIAGTTEYIFFLRAHDAFIKINHKQVH